MTTTVVVHNRSDEQSKPSIEHRHLLRPPPLNLPTTTFKPLPSAIIKSIESDRRHRLSHSHSASDVLRIQQSSIDTTDEDLDENEQTQTTITTNSNRQRFPSEIRVTLYPDPPREHLRDSQNELSTSTTYENELRSSNPSLLETRSSREKRVDYLRRRLLERRIGRRIHSSFSSATTLRSFNRRRSTHHFSHRLLRRYPWSLSRNSKWHFVRAHLHDIAMMSESYARMRTLEQDLRWIHLREQIRKRVLDMREMVILRQQDDGVAKKSQKTSFNLKTIPINEVIHVEHDGRVYSMGTRDLVLGRLIDDEEIQLDTFAQLDARRKFQVKQSLLKQQEGRTRLKKHIAFSFCLCNLSFIALMFATMFIFAMNTIIQLRSRESL